MLVPTPNPQSQLTQRTRRYVSELTKIFKTASSKHRAHERSRPILEDISTDRVFITAVLQNYLARPEVLNSKNYPAVSMNVELNPYYHLVMNCWIPLPQRETDVSTKAIHHHGTMLLSTATIFGPGYEHWLFTKPEELDPSNELYAMEVTERKLHALHDIAFVDAFKPHLPLFPAGLTVTLALWSSQNPITWKDRLKRVPVLKKNEGTLRRIAVRTGLARGLDLKIVQYFDFYPAQGGFKGMQERIEFGLGPNEDYLQSLFHVIQGTENDHLAPVVEQHIDSGGVALTNRQRLKELLKDLRQGRSIEGKLSDCHLNVPHATFRSQEIEKVVMALRNRKSEDGTLVHKS